MANKTIPQLPEQTGKTNDDLLVIVDSGETTTSKIKVSTLLDGIGGGKFIQATGSTTTNIIPDYYPLDSIYAYQAGQTTSLNFIAGGELNDIVVRNNTYKGNVVVGGYSNRIYDSQYWAGIFGSYNSQINGIGTIPKGSVIIGGESNTTNGWAHTIAGESNTGSGYYYSVLVGGQNNSVSSTADRGNGIFGGKSNSITQGSRVGIINGINNIISSGADSVIIGGSGNTTTHSRSVILGGSSLSSSYDDEVLVPNLTISNYASLNYADDTAAAAGGVVLGQVYHNNGDLRIRIV